MLLRVLLALLLVALPVAAEETVVADLSQNRVSITANFDGTGILIFGAVKRQAPPPDAGPLQVIVAVTGPAKPVTVRRKERTFGIWINRDAVTIDSAPAFYAVASTAPLDLILAETEDLRYKISLARQIRSVGVAEVKGAEEFAEAVVRIRHKAGQYSETGGHVKLIDETLFRTQIALPSNLVEGDYSTRIFLVRDRQVVDQYETVIAVRKVGLERWIYNLAHDLPLVYGLLSLTIAIAAGWLASAIFRLLRLN
jgi:uncharacterized protein (TIGR02186 family)